MVQRIISVGDDFTLPASVKAADANLPAASNAAAVAAKANAADVVPKWRTATSYTAGQQVVSPNGDVVSSIATHTSGASFTPANWNFTPAKSLVDSDVTLSRTLDELGNPVLRTPNRFNAGSVRFKDDPKALNIVEVPGTNGRRLSIEPVDQANSTASSQLQIVPGGNVATTEVTAQILIYNKTGADYERFVTSAFNGEYQFHSSRLGAGLARPTFFYVDNQLVTSWLVDRTFAVDQALRIGPSTGYVTLTAPASGVLATTGIIRVAEGTAYQVRLGNVAALNRPTVSFGDGTVNISRNGAQLDVAGGLTASGAFGVNGKASAGKQTVAAAATDAATTMALTNQLRAAMITFGLAV